MSTDSVISVLAKDFTAAADGSIRESSDFSNLTLGPADKQAGFFEWKVNLPRAGTWRLRVLMTSATERPMTLTINGVRQTDTILNEVTGSWRADKLTWFVYGPYDFKKDENIVRLDYATGSPHLKELTFAEMVPSSVLAFNGTTSYVEVADPFEDDTAFTVTLWAKTAVLNDGTTHGLIGKTGETYSKPALWLGPADGALHYESSSPSGERFAGSIDNFFEKDKWTHIAWIKRGTKYEFYRDGKLVAEKPAPARYYSRKSSYWIGRREGFWNGQITLVRVWALSRSADEIRAGTRGQPSNDNLGLVSFWAFDDAQGTSVRDKADRAAHGFVQATTWERSLIPFVADSGITNTNVLPTWTSIGGSVTDIVMRRHADGRLIIAARGTDGALHVVSQKAPNAAEWAPVQNLAGGIKGAPVIATHADGRLFCAAIGMDDQLCSRQQTAANSETWAAYKHHPGCTLLAIAAIVNSDGRIGILGRGKDNQLWYLAQTAPNADTWNDWAPLGGSLGSALTAVRTETNRVEVFARGSEGDLWHTWQDSAGSAAFRPWHPLGGHIVDAPAVVKNADGRFQAFVRGSNDALQSIMQTTPNGLWDKWVSLGKGGTGGVSAPLAITDAGGRIVVFVQGKDSSLWSICQTLPNGDFGEWTYLAGSVGRLAATRNADGRILLCTVRTDNTISYICEKTPGRWT
ncbi:MAG TPA: hypothetical protein PK156_02995 [Polyangium sp.]|nr:hypothetical protein [Polyangium sp.]